MVPLSSLSKGDLLLANSTSLGLQSHPEWHLSVLLSYANSLCEDLQYRRAVVGRS